MSKIDNLRNISIIILFRNMEGIMTVIPRSVGTSENHLFEYTNFAMTEKFLNRNINYIQELIFVGFLVFLRKNKIISVLKQVS